jgi:hypothetical protein
VNEVRLGDRQPLTAYKAGSCCRRCSQNMCLFPGRNPYDMGSRAKTPAVEEYLKRLIFMEEQLTLDGGTSEIYIF